MKTNIIMHVVVTICFVLFANSSSIFPKAAKKYHKSKTKKTAQPNISVITSPNPEPKADDYHFESLLNTTPLQFSMKSLRSYFQAHQVGVRGLHSIDDANVEPVEETFNRGFSEYVDETYNKQHYATALSQDGSHLLDFLELSDEINLSQTTLYVGLRLFHNKMKSCEIIDDTVMLQVIEPLGKHLERYFQESDTRHKVNTSFFRKNTENLMLSRFTDHYTTFQEEPDIFLQDLSDEITKAFKSEMIRVETTMKKEHEELESRERLRSLTMRFIEMLLGKTMWSTQSHEGIWFSFQAIAHDIQSLGNRSVVNHMDDLDSLLWSHVHRFCYFIDLVGSHLPLEFYEEIENDLRNKIVYFLEEGEQDACIKSKKETLEDALIKGRMKAVAFNKGIIDHII